MRNTAISDRRDDAGQIIFHTLTEAEKQSIRLHDLAIIRDPYVALGIVVLIMLVIIALKPMPKTTIATNQAPPLRQTLQRLLHNPIYREGVIAQVFYVAAQIMTWTFIIQYADNLGIDKATAQRYNILAMALFLTSRFLSTLFMRYTSPQRMLALFGTGAILATLGTILIQGTIGLYCLVAISAFMSLMFPTIYGIALENVQPADTTLGAAFLVMAIVGGALMPPLQGHIIDYGTILGQPAVNISYTLPLLSFIVITIYALRTQKQKSKTTKTTPNQPQE